MDNYEKIIKKLASLERQIERLKIGERGWSYKPLTTPLTSTDFDGDSFSTTAKTKIDLSDKFGVPAGVKAVDVIIYIKDSGSSGANIGFRVSPNNVNYSGAVILILDGVPNDSPRAMSGKCPCDANGDIYYQVQASGTGTMDVTIQIWGYYI